MWYCRGRFSGAQRDQLEDLNVGGGVAKTLHFQVVIERWNKKMVHVEFIWNNQVSQSNFILDSMANLLLSESIIKGKYGPTQNVSGIICGGSLIIFVGVKIFLDWDQI